MLRFMYKNKKTQKFIKRNIRVLLFCYYRKVLNDIANNNAILMLLII